MSSDEDNDCPLCLEEIDIYDKYFKPCPCGYQLCRFCWNHIKKDLNALCPACRRPYSDDTVEFKPVPPEELAKIKNRKKRKEKERRENENVNRKQLANVRVVQKNLVYVLGLPLKLASEEVLKSSDYFGQYGRITKVVVNRKSPGPHSTTPNTGVYITYLKKDDAAKAIEAVDGTHFEGKVIRATFGTTKYCSYFLKNLPCQNIGCQFLHENGEDAEAYLKEESRLYNTRTEKSNKIAFSSNRKDELESGLPPTASWWENINIRGKSTPLLNSERQFPTLSQTPSESSLPQDQEQCRQDGSEEVKYLGSACLTKDSIVPEYDAEWTLERAIFFLPRRYNGLFDPFGGSRLTNTILALVKNQNEAEQLAENGDASSQKSRFERLFDGNVSEKGGSKSDVQDSKKRNDQDFQAQLQYQQQQIMQQQSPVSRKCWKLFFRRSPGGQTGGFCGLPAEEWTFWSEDVVRTSIGQILSSNSESSFGAFEDLPSLQYVEFKDPIPSTQVNANLRQNLTSVGSSSLYLSESNSNPIHPEGIGDTCHELIIVDTQTIRMPNVANRNEIEKVKEIIPSAIVATDVKTTPTPLTPPQVRRVLTIVPVKNSDHSNEVTPASSTHEGGSEDCSEKEDDVKTKKNLDWVEKKEELSTEPVIEPVISRKTKKKKFRPEIRKPKKIISKLEKGDEKEIVAKVTPGLPNVPIQSSSSSTSDPSKHNLEREFEDNDEKLFKLSEIKCLSDDTIVAKPNQFNKIDTCMIECDRRIGLGCLSDEELKGSDPCCDETNINGNALEFEVFINEIQAIKVFSKNFGLTLDSLETDCNSAEEFKKVFLEYTANMLPDDFKRLCITPFIATINSKIERILSQVGISEQDLKKLENIVKDAEAVVDELAKCANRIDVVKSYWKDDTNSESPNKYQVREQSNSYEEYQAILKKLQSNCKDVISAQESFLAGIETENDTINGINVNEYFAQILSAVNELILQSRHRLPELVKMKSHIIPLFSGGNPIYCLAALTGIDPMKLAILSDSQQSAFVTSIQSQFQTPLALLKTLMESKREIDFSNHLKAAQMTQSKSIENYKEYMEKLQNEYRDIQAKCNRTREKHKDIIAAFNQVFYESDEEEWVDDDEWMDG